MTTVSEIAREAFDAVAAEVTDAIHAAVLTYMAKGPYNATTGAYASVPVPHSGRCVEDSTKPVGDVFDGYIVGPAEVLVLLEGFAVVPEENWTLTYAGKKRTIMKVQDIVAAGTLFYVVAR